MSYDLDAVRGSTQPLDAWRGHLQVTYHRLLPILTRAALGDIEFSRAERILYTVCEFWSAIAARTLVSHLGSQAVDNLQVAATAFSEIGAMNVVDSLNAALEDLPNATQQQFRERLSALEGELHNTTDAVDQLIARFAKNCGAPLSSAAHSRVIT